MDNKWYDTGGDYRLDLGPNETLRVDYEKYRGPSEKIVSTQIVYRKDLDSSFAAFSTTDGELIFRGEKNLMSKRTLFENVPGLPRRVRESALRLLNMVEQDLEGCKDDF